MWDSTAIAPTHERGRKCSLARAGGVREGHHLVHVANLELTGDELMLVTWRRFLPLSLGRCPWDQCLGRPPAPFGGC